MARRHCQYTSLLTVADQVDDLGHFLVSRILKFCLDDLGHVLVIKILKLCTNVKVSGLAVSIPLPAVRTSRVVAQPYDHAFFTESVPARQIGILDLVVAASPA